YRQPALVEEFIEGTEYTIGLVGSYVLPILALDLAKIPGHPVVRDVHVKEIDTGFSEGLSFDDAPDRYRAFAATAVRFHGALDPPPRHPDGRDLGGSRAGRGPADPVCPRPCREDRLSG